MSARGQRHRHLALSRLLRSWPILVTVSVAALTLGGALTARRQAQRNADARRATLSADIRVEAVNAVNVPAQRAADLAAGVGANWSARGAIFAAVAPGLAREPSHQRRRTHRARNSRSAPPLRAQPRRIEAPFSAGGTQRPAPARSDYFVVTASRQRVRGSSGLGPDVGEEPARHATLLMAAASGAPRATPPVRMMSDDQPGTALHVPIYRRSARSLQTAATPGRGAGGSSRWLPLQPLLRPCTSVPAGTAFALTTAAPLLLAQGRLRNPTHSRIAVAGRTWMLPSAHLLPISR